MKRADSYPSHYRPDCSDRNPMWSGHCPRCSAIVADDRDAFRSALEHIAATCPGRSAEVARTALAQADGAR